MLHKRILHTLINAGFEAYMVGGYVRDTLLRRESKDIDITTSATPAQVLTLFPNAEGIGAHFGVVLVKEGDKSVEVATFRSDGLYKDSRHPTSVTFTQDPAVDMLRRDFTINALIMDQNGIIHDHVGGRDDLENKLIRAVGDPLRRFEEDALRMLRAIRFACQLGFTIEPNTFESMKARAIGIKNISVERVREELNRILVSGRAAYGLRLLMNSNLIVHTIPEVVKLVDCPQNPLYHPEGDVFTHTLGLLVKLPKGCSLTLALSALLHDIGKPATLDEKHGQPTFHGHEDVGAELAEKIMQRLKYSNEEIEVVRNHVLQHMRFRVAQDMRRSKLYRFLRQPNFAELLMLHKLDAGSGSGNMANAEFVESILSEVPPEKISPPKLVTGKDLIALGLEPGPRFREILETLETEQLEGRIVERESALSFVQGMVHATP